jgi:hypothetical protein
MRQPNSLFRRVRPCFWGALALALVVGGGRITRAHTPITSKYAYNEDVFPIFRDRCGQCHYQGGPAPMSLLTYHDAVPWAQSIREELVAEKMPPWFRDPSGPATKGEHPISAREMDVIITWASGGTPQGDLQKTPPTIASHPQWKAGPPDLKLTMDVEHIVKRGSTEEHCDFTLPTNLSETMWVKAADLLPGTPSMVRDAVISVENGPVLSVWVPGNDAIAAPSGAAFRLPAGAKIRLHIHYKKSYLDEQEAKSDQSTIGLYFTDQPTLGREILTLDVAASPTEANSGQPRSFAANVTSVRRVLAVRPSLDQPYGTVDIRGVTPSGTKVPLLRLRSPRPEWPRRYWLTEPVELPSGSKIEVTTTPAPSDDDPKPLEKVPLQIAVEYVPV